MMFKIEKNTRRTKQTRHQLQQLHRYYDNVNHNIAAVGSNNMLSHLTKSSEEVIGSSSNLDLARTLSVSRESPHAAFFVRKLSVKHITTERKVEIVRAGWSSWTGNDTFRVESSFNLGESSWLIWDTLVREVTSIWLWCPDISTNGQIA